MICHPGTLSINKPDAGWPQAALRLWLMICAGCCEKPKGAIGSDRAAIFDSRTLQSTPESGNHAGYDGAKRRKGSKVHAAVDTASPPPESVGDSCQ